MIVYLEKESTTVEFRFIFSSVGNGDGYMPAEILAVSPINIFSIQLKIEFIKQ